MAKIIILSALIFMAIFLAFPLILSGMETEQNMRRAQVQEIYNTDK